MFVRQRREGDGGESSGLEPMDHGGVDGDGLLGGDVRTVLQVVVLTLLLRFQVKTRQSAQILLANGFVDLERGMGTGIG